MRSGSYSPAGAVLGALVAFCLTAPGAAPAGRLRAGVGQADITPPVGTPLGGYAARRGAPSTGVHDPIRAKALVLEDGDLRLAIVTTDLVGIAPEMPPRVAERANFPVERLLLCASHTHSGPGAYGRGPFATLVLGSYRPEVFDRLTDGMAQALARAVAGLQPARLAVGERPFPEFMRNRRGTPLIDPALWVMRVDGDDGRPLAAVVNLAAHGTVLTEKNLEFSADWMGFTQAFLEREVPGLTALYTNGAEGDLSPNIPDGAATFEGARAHGELAGRVALELYRTLRPSADVSLACRTAPLDLPQTLAGALIGAGKRTTLQCMTIGEALLIAVPGEPIAQLGLALKAHARRQGHHYPAVVALANDHLGYLLTRAEMRKGGYEARVSFFGDGFGEELTLALGRLIGGDVEPLEQDLRTEPGAR